MIAKFVQFYQSIPPFDQVDERSRWCENRRREIEHLQRSVQWGQSPFGWLHGQDLKNWVEASAVSGRIWAVENLIKYERQSFGRYSNSELIQLRVWFCDCQDVAQRRQFAKPCTSPARSVARTADVQGAAQAPLGNPALNPGSFPEFFTFQNLGGWDA